MGYIATIYNQITVLCTKNGYHNLDRIEGGASKKETLGTRPIFAHQIDCWLNSTSHSSSLSKYANEL
jgi:hypothetical protein